MFRHRRFLPEGKMRALISFVFITLILFLIIEGFIFVESRLRPNIISIAEVRAENIATETVNQAIMEKIAGDVFYRELILIEKDDNGKIVLAQLNTAEANRIISETVLITLDTLKNVEKIAFDIPLGEVMGSYLLATYGPRIPVRLISAGKLNVKLHDSYEESGINQVRHKIYLQIGTEMRIVIPFISSPIHIDVQVPIADAIYPGEVPETVVNIEFPF